MDKVILLADKNSKAWDFAKKIQKYIQDKKKFLIPLEEVFIGDFGNKEIDMYMPESIREKKVYFIHDSTKNPQQWWVELLLLKDLLPGASVKNFSFVLPDILYSRQDKKDRPRVPISARTLARSISPGVKNIITMDLHSPQIHGFYPEEIPLTTLYSFTEVVRYLKENKTIKNLEKLVIVSPDSGGVDRAKAFAQRLGSQYPVAFIYKRRENKGKRKIEEMIFVGDVADKNCFIIDDIIDSGGTLCKAADLLRQNKAQKLFCYGTHGLFTKGTEEICKNFEKVITSNTHYQKRNNIEVIDITPTFAKAIYRIQKELSISKLFE